MIYPKFIKKGSNIEFVAPSLGASIEPYLSRTKKAKENLEELGYNIIYGPNCFSNHLALSNTKELCGEEINDAFSNPEIDALISVGGGELMCEVMNHVDFELIHQNPKWFMGFSDNTNLTFLITTIADVASVYGVNAAAYCEKDNSDNVDALNVLSGKNLTIQSYPKYELVKLSNSENPFLPINLDTPSIKRYYNLEPNAKFSGRLLGGCLDIFNILCGTKFDKVQEFIDNYQNDGIIWYLEACDLNVLSIRRVMFQLDNAGWFKNVKGFIIGRPFSAEDEVFGIDKYQAVLDIISKYNVPIIMDADLGHFRMSHPIVNGSIGTVTRIDDEYKIEMKFE